MARSKHPAGAMFLGAVASTGETSPPIWFPEGFRLGANGYIEALRDTLIPWMRQVAQNRGNVPSSSTRTPPLPTGQKKLKISLKKKGLIFGPLRNGRQIRWI